MGSSGELVMATYTEKALTVIVLGLLACVVVLVVNNGPDHHSSQFAPASTALEADLSMHPAAPTCETYFGSIDQNAQTTIVDIDIIGAFASSFCTSNNLVPPCKFIHGVFPGGKCGIPSAPDIGICHQYVKTTYDGCDSFPKDTMSLSLHVDTAGRFFDNGVLKGCEDKVIKQEKHCYTAPDGSNPKEMMAHTAPVVKCECPASGNVGGKGLWNVLFEPAGTYTNAPVPEQLNTPRFDTMRARWDYYLKTVFAS